MTRAQLERLRRLVYTIATSLRTSDQLPTTACGWSELGAELVQAATIAQREAERIIDHADRLRRARRR